MIGGESIDVNSGWASESTELPVPADLLAATFSDFLLKNLEWVEAILDSYYDGAQVEATVRRHGAPPRLSEIAYEVFLTTDESERRVDLVYTNLRKYGAVFNTLAASCDVHGRIVAEPRRRRAPKPPSTSGTYPAFASLAATSEPYVG